MILLKPQAQVFQQNVEGVKYYYLHSTTYFENSGYENDGHEPLPLEVDSDGFFNVTLKVKDVDTTAPVLDYITPVVHIVPLGSVSLEEGEVKIGVILIHNGSEVSRATVMDIDVKEKSRPEIEL